MAAYNGVAVRQSGDRIPPAKGPTGYGKLRFLDFDTGAETGTELESITRRVPISTSRFPSRPADSRQRFETVFLVTCNNSVISRWSTTAAYSVTLATRGDALAPRPIKVTDDFDQCKSHQQAGHQR